MSVKLLTREQVERTRARVIRATDNLWDESQGHAPTKLIKLTIDQLTELSDDLLHELYAFDRALTAEPVVLGD
jgi:hypothetical protein